MTRTLRRLTALVIVAALPSSLIAQKPARRSKRATSPASSGIVKGATVEGITQYTLANGLRVVLFPDASQPTATVNITYLV
ncbi:MAG: hypothetical protein ACREL4_02530, partial [Gemmatimonadales bacterium]